MNANTMNALDDLKTTLDRLMAYRSELLSYAARTVDPASRTSRMTEQAIVARQIDRVWDAIDALAD